MNRCQRCGNLVGECSECSFTDEELILIRDALGQRFCLLETGTNYSLDDAARMDDETKKQLGIRSPSVAQMDQALKVRRLWERILRRGL